MMTRGSAPVGQLADLDPVSACAVMYLRCGARQSRNGRPSASLQGDFSANAQEAFDALHEVCTAYGRRPLARHDVGCRCLGADESCFAHFIGCASEGAMDDALMFAMVLVRPDMAPVLAGLAQDFGLALRRLASQIAPIEPHATRH